MKLAGKKQLSVLFGSFLLSIIILYFITPLVLTRVPQKNLNGSESEKAILNTSPDVAIAKEIYPEFLCGCCGKPLNSDEICCGMAKSMIDFIDKEVQKKVAKNEIIMSGVKEFGFNSLAKEETKKEITRSLAESAPVDAPRIVFKEVDKNLGKIKQSNGITTAIFVFRNEGKSDLVINNISTSCGCTSASIVYKGKEGPEFAMPGHGKENPKDWSVSISPKEEAEVKVYYDPNAHGRQSEELIPITRTIDIFSNDPVEFEKRLKIGLDQVP